MKDAFISHASEDKDVLAEPIYHALLTYGKKVWLDKYALVPGRSLMKQIDEGLSAAEFGILLITPAFMKKDWPQAELHALFGAMMAGEKKIIPVWHNVTSVEVRQFSPLLADNVAIMTKNKSTDQIVTEILRVMSPQIAEGILRAETAKEKLKTGEYRPARIDELDRLKPGPIVHDELPDRVITDAVLICEVLHEQGLRFENFMDDLMRDHDYEKELCAWHMIAAIYHWSVRKYNLTSSEQRREAFVLLLLVSMDPKLPLERTRLKHLDEETKIAIKEVWGSGILKLGE